MAHRTRGVLLDVDGTLVDSNTLHAEAWSEALAEFGYTVEVDRVRRLIGKGGDKVLPELTGLDEESDEGKEILERRGALFEERYLSRVTAFPKSRALLERMREVGLSLAVATSASKKELDPLLERAGVTGLIEEKTSSDDAKDSKPDPDIIQAALDKLGYEAAECVMLGDTPYDVEAAIRAGVRVVAVRCGGWSDADLEGAEAIYDDPADLLSRFDKSPFRT